MSVGTIRIGTSGWNYPSGRGTWNGLFYPAKEFDARAVSAVAELVKSRARLNLVEEREMPLWKLEYAFAALVFLLGLEWLLRRRRGLA